MKTILIQLAVHYPLKWEWGQWRESHGLNIYKPAWCTQSCMGPGKAHQDNGEWEGTHSCRGKDFCTLVHTALGCRRNQGLWQSTSPLGGPTSAPWKKLLGPRNVGGSVPGSSPWVSLRSALVGFHSEQLPADSQISFCVGLAVSF